MKNLNRILPFLLCLVLAISAAASCSIAYAAEAVQPMSISADDVTEGGGDASASTGMFAATAELGQALMSGIWSLFGLYVPGFSFTFGQMWLGVLLASVSILVIRMLFGFGGSASSGVSSRTSSTNHPRISKERRRDQF